MRILKIFDGDYPWDVRVEKIVGTLLEAGHPVRLVCRNRAGRVRRERLSDGLEIQRLPTGSGFATFPFFLSPVWAASIVAGIRDFGPDRILVRDLPLAPLAIVLGRLWGIPVLADLAEPYPDSLRSLWRFQRMSWVDRIVRNPALADWVERLVLRTVDRALVVCPEAGRRLERQGLDPTRWTEVGNTPRLESFRTRVDDGPKLEGLEGRFVVLFSGLLAGDRGLDVAIDALALVARRSPGDFALVIVGEGPVRADLEARVAALGLGRDVRFTGWIEHGRLPGVIAQASVGVLPFHACEHINSTLANKLFEYMAIGLPVVVSDVPPMLRILSETDAGVAFRSGDAEDLARAIEAMAEAPERTRRYGEAGRSAVVETYHWEIDARRLLRALESPGSG